MSYDSLLAALDPTAWWKLADASGSGTAADSSGNGWTGTPAHVTFGETSLILAQPAETSALFNGSSTDVSSTYKPSGLTSLSAVVWLNAQGNDQSYTRLLATDAPDYSGDKGFEIFVNGTTNLQVLTAVGNGTSEGTVGSDGTIPITGSQMVVVTWDGTTIRQYLNGSLDSYTATIAGPMAEGSDGMMIGAAPTFGPGSFFDGLIAEVAFFANVVLTSTQVSALYSAATTVSGSGSLVAGFSASGAGGITLSGTGSLAGTATLSGSGIATLSGTGTLAASFAATGIGTVELSGTGSLAASFVASGSGTVTDVVSGSGVLSAAFSATGSASVELSGTGSLSAAFSARGTGIVSLSGTGTLSANFTANGTGIILGTVTGTGQLSASFVAAGSGTVELAGSGWLNASFAASAVGVVHAAVIPGLVTVTDSLTSDLTLIDSVTGAVGISDVIPNSVSVSDSQLEGVALTDSVLTSVNVLDVLV